jgi:hypothetical protein
VSRTLQTEYATAFSGLEPDLLCFSGWRSAEPGNI